MTFEPGHPQHPPALPLHGKHAVRKQAQASLAAMIRDKVPPDVIVEWLVGVWQGRDPTTGEAITDFATRQSALKMLLERGYGLPEQSLKIEAQVAAIVATIDADPVLDKIPDMTIEQLRALAALGVGLLPEGAGEDDQ